MITPGRLVCFVVGSCCFVEARAQAAAWVDPARYLVPEAKQGRWEAQWIDAGDGIPVSDFGRVFYLRKSFETREPGAFRRVHVSADSRYKLWVNGTLVARGPARFDPLHQQYDTLDLSTLVRPGRNVIAAEVMYWGEGEPSRGGPIFQMGVRPAFVFESPEVKSDPSWKTLVSAGMKAAAWENVFKGKGYFAGNWMEQADARGIPVGWERAGFNDAAWSPARKIARAETWGEGDSRAPWKLQPRSIGPVEERAPESARAVQSGRVGKSKARPPFSFEVTPNAGTPALPLTLPGDGRVRYVVFDAGRLVTAFPRLEIDAKEGAVVEIMYAEAPSLNFKKERRDVLGDKRVEGLNDIYITRAGRQTYEPFFHRTFWFVRVAVKSDKPVTIRGLDYRWTSYAFEERGAFECSDAKLNRIWKVGWDTGRLCAHETYEDTPYYEQLQYAGDARIQALLTYYMSGDARLPANAIRQLNASRVPEGLTLSRYPSHLFQSIPGFSLLWVLMLDDYLLHTGDLKLVRECAGGVYSVLRSFENYQTEQGFLANVPYWNYHDWTFPKGGAPPGSKVNCTLTTLLYKGALDAGTRLFDALDDRDEANRFRQRSAAVAAAVNERAWSESEGLYLDGIGVDSLSQHVNTYAVLFDVADAGRSARIAERLFMDPKLRETTFYFAHYLHQAAVKLGQPERVISDMSRWQEMLDLGSSTWWETASETRSDCHAWSSAPTFEFMQEILGVRPAAPGFAKVRIAPFTSNLEWARGAVPTPHGEIRIDWRKPAGERFEIEFELPAGVEAELILPSGLKRPFGPGRHQVKDS